MQDQSQAVLSTLQPLIKLTQANLALLTQFSTSPEVLAQSTANLQDLLQRAQKTAIELSHSGAFAQLLQGAARNYTEFFSELGMSGMSGMAALTQGQGELARQAQELGSQVVDVAERSARARPAR